MSEQSQGPGWWRASDGRWYPPETHPGYRPPPPPPPSPSRATGRPRREKRGTPLWKLALGVCLGILLFFVVCSALISSGIDDATERRAAVVRVEAAPDVCWSGSIGEATRDGCGDARFDVETTVGNLVSANVQKRSPGPGLLSIVIEIDGEEVARNSTEAEFGVAMATSGL